MPEVDMSALTEAIQNGISSGFTRVINEINAGNLRVGNSAGGPGGGNPGAPGGGSGGSGGTGSGPGGNTATPAATPESSAELEAAATTPPEVTGLEETLTSRAADVMKKFKEGIEGVFEDVIEMQGSWYVTQYQNLIRDLGPEVRKVSAEAFAAGDFSSIFNEGEKAAARSVRAMGNYAAELVKYDGLSLREISARRRDIIETFGDTNVNLLHQSTEAMERESIRFSNAMNISADETAQLIGVTFAETGEASEDILMQITQQASAVGDAVGLPLKVMAQGIKEVKLDMDTFTDMTVEGAARMVASLSQLGMSLQTFKGMMQPFRDFDSAATKMGDMSAIFGVQMDAMEMMYLANEDEEQFLHKMREQILDQGLDVESMSKTRQRALAEQLGMGVKEMKMFMNTGQVFADQSELQEASAEGAAKTQAETMEMLNNSMIAVTRSAQEMKAIVQNIQGLFAAPAYSQFAENMGKSQNAIIQSATNVEGISEHVRDVQTGLAELTADVSTNLSAMMSVSIPALDKFAGGIADSMKEGFTNLVTMAKEAAPAAFADLAHNTNADFVNSDASQNSWPVMFHGLARTFADTSVPGGQESRDFYTASVMSWGDMFVVAIDEAITKISDSVHFEGLIENFRDASLEINKIANDISVSMAAIESPNIQVTGATKISAELRLQISRWLLITLQKN